MRRHGRLVLRAALRLAEHLRRAAGQGEGRLLPDRPGTTSRYITKQLYLPGTTVLITRFISADGVAEVMDFMPVTGERATDAHRLVRMVTWSGAACVPVEFRPRFDYAREEHRTERHRNGFVFRGRTASLTFNPVDPTRS